MKAILGIFCSSFGGLLWSWQSRNYGTQVIPLSYDEWMCSICAILLAVAGGALIYKGKSKSTSNV